MNNIVEQFKRMEEAGWANIVSTEKLLARTGDVVKAILDGLEAKGIPKVHCRFGHDEYTFNVADGIIFGWWVNLKFSPLDRRAERWSTCLSARATIVLICLSVLGSSLVGSERSSVSRPSGICSDGGTPQCLPAKAHRS